MALGDSLTSEQKAEYIRTRLVPGRIVHAVLNLNSGLKPKFLLVAHVGIETMGLVINSVINNFKQSRPHLRECQVVIDQASHPFLEHDSFVDCSQSHYEDTNTLREQLLRDVTGIKDPVSVEVRGRIVQAVRTSFVLEKTEKQKLLDALSL